MLDLLRRYEAEAVDRACAFASSSNITSFKFVRTYLSHHAAPLRRFSIASMHHSHLIEIRGKSYRLHEHSMSARARRVKTPA